ncbi:hypothetical protein Trydic_g12737, partial [Trypoxylus dichotomus]
CKSIFTKTNRYNPPLDPDYENTPIDFQTKLNSCNYYTTYIRLEAERLRLSMPSRKGIGDYNIANRRKLLANDVKLPTPHHLKAIQNPETTEYLPLVLHPIQILNIIVDPLVLRTGPVMFY